MNPTNVKLKKMEFRELQEDVIIPMAYIPSVASARIVKTKQGDWLAGYYYRGTDRILEAHTSKEEAMKWLEEEHQKRWWDEFNNLLEFMETL